MAKEIEKTVSLEDVQQDLIERSKAKGTITYKEIIDTLQPYDLSVESLDNFYDKLAQHGIEIVDDTVDGQAAVPAEADDDSKTEEDLSLPEALYFNVSLGDG